MEIFGTKRYLIIINFLNKRVIKLLQVLKENSPIKSTELRKKVKDIGLLPKSTFYRYIDFLLKNKLIQRSEERKRIGGYEYNLEKIGELFLNIITDSNFNLYNTRMKKFKEIIKL